MLDEKILLVKGDVSKESDTTDILSAMGFEVSELTSNIEEILNGVDKLYDIIVLDRVSFIPDANVASKFDELNIPVIFIVKQSESSALEGLGIKIPHKIIILPLEALELKYAVELLIYENKTENELKERDNKFFLLFENSPLPYQSLDENGNFLDVNPAWLKCLGYSKEEVMGKSFAEFLAPGYSDHFKKNFPMFKAAGEIHGVEFEMKRRDGSYIFVSYEGKIGYDELGSFKQTHCIFQDITERKTYEEKIEKLNHLYATLSQINQSIIRIKDRNELFQTVCDVFVEYGKFQMAWVGLIDYDTGDIKPVAYSGNESGYLEKICLNIYENPSIYKPSSMAVNKGSFSVTENIETDFDCEWREEAVNRGYRSLFSIPINLNGDAIGIINIYSSKPNFFVGKEVDLINEIGLDVSFALKSMETESNKRAAENALRKSEKNYRELVDNSLVGIYKTNLNGEILFANEAMARIFKYNTVEELKKLNIFDIYKNYHDRVQFIAKIKEDGKVKDYEMEFVGSDGQTVNVLISANLDGDVLSGMFMDITDRIQVEERFHSIIQNAADLFIIVDKTGTITFNSPSSERILGYSEDFLIGRDPTDFVHPEDRKQFRMYLKKVYESRNVGIFTEFRIIKSNGDYLPVESVSQNMMDVSGIEGLMVTSHPIQERKEMEETILKSEERYKTLFELDPDYTILLGLDGVIMDVNSAAVQVNGLSKEELVGKHFMEIDMFPEEDRDLHDEMFSKLLEDEDVAPYESRIMDSNGVLHWVKTVLTVVRKGNVPPYFLVIATDITELKNKEEALKENQRTLETLISNLPGVAYKCKNDPEWTMEFVSDGCYELTGYHTEDLVMNNKISFNDLIHPDDKQMVWDTIQKSLHKREPFKMLYKICTKDSRIKYVWEQGTGIFSDDGEIISLEGFITDVTLRIINEEKIKESEIYYRTMFENTGTATIIVDSDMTISQLNTEAARLSGYSKDEIENKKKWTDFIVESDLERLKNYFNLRNRSPSVPRNYETRFSTKAGDVKDIYVTIAPIPGTDKELASILDITETKKAEKDLQGSLNEKDILMKEIHHRVKNNMQIVSSLLNLQTQYVDGDESQNVLKESQGRVKTMAMIHEKLYQSNDFTHIRFDDYIMRLVSDIFYSYNVRKERIEPVIHVDEVNLNIETAIPCGLILNELISNSLKYAFPGDATGSISLTLTKSGENYELTISDDGVGFPESLDFRSTDSLGLQLVNSLVDQIDGSITLDTDHGTKFNIKFKELEYKERI